MPFLQSDRVNNCACASDNVTLATLEQAEAQDRQVKNIVKVKVIKIIINVSVFCIRGRFTMKSYFFRLNCCFLTILVTSLVSNTRVSYLLNELIYAKGDTIYSIGLVTRSHAAAYFLFVCSPGKCPCC